MNYLELILEVINRFRERIGKLNSAIGEVINQETLDKELKASENQIDKAEKKLKKKKRQLADEDQEERSWFQSKEDRQMKKGLCFKKEDTTCFHLTSNNDYYIYRFGLSTILLI